jgi:diguanylate cyclase (GGDEF)-like protein
MAVGDAFVARVGGDEFTVIANDADDGSKSAELARRLILAGTEDLHLDGQWLRVGMSVGIAVFPQHGTDAMTLLANADLALYRAKANERGNALYFTPEMGAQVRERRAMQEELRDATVPATSPSSTSRRYP